MADWRRERLGDHAQISARIGWRGLSADEYVDSGPFLIAGKHIVSGSVDWGGCDHLTEDRYRESPEIALQIGDVIISKDGTIGRVARIDSLPGPATLNGTMMLVRPTGSLDHRYLSHLLNGSAFKKLVEERISGSSVPHLFQRDLITLPVSLPPLEEQRRIGEILDTVDETIQATERVIAKKEMALDGLAAHLMSHSSPFREWDERHLGEWTPAGCPITYGIVQAGPHIPNGIPYIRTGDMRTELRIEGLLRTSQRIAQGYARSRVSEGDIVCAIRATVGTVLVVPPELDGANLTQGTARIAPGPNADRHCLLWALRSEEVRTQIRAVQKGTTFQEMTLNQLRTLMVRLPAGLSDQRRLAASLRGVEAAVRTEQLALDKLRELRSGLAADLLSGRVRAVAA